MAHRLSGKVAIVTGWFYKIISQNVINFAKLY